MLRRIAGNSLACSAVCAFSLLLALVSPGGPASAATIGHASPPPAVKTGSVGTHAPLARAKRWREAARPANVVKIKVHRKAARKGLAEGAVAPAAPPQPPFAECPADGQDTSCGILIQITDTANNIL